MKNIFLHGLFLLTCLVLLSSFNQNKKHPEPPPNVLMISIDDLNDWLGCLNGHPNAKTPNIDRLAAKGVLFSNAHCQATKINNSLNYKSRRILRPDVGGSEKGIRNIRMEKTKIR